jgi:spermidine/putrescine transport system substrate-binding protein
MKKTFALILSAFLLLLPIYAPAAQETITVYNWGDYIDPDVLDQFEAETGIRVIYETFETNEDMYTKISKAKASYDVIFPSDYMVERMIREKLVQPINWDNIPNAVQIQDRFRNLSYDPDNAYSVPYTWGTMGILYNTGMVSEAPVSWNVLWDEQYADSILMLNASRDTLAITLKALGYPLNSTDEAQLEEAKQRLIDQSPMVLAYVVDEVKDKMIAGEAAVALVWSGDATYCMSESDELDYVIPEEGSNIFFDAICIPANAKNVSGAERFIDYLCDPEIARQNYEYVGYAIPNQGAIDLMGDEYLSSPVSNPPQELLDRCEIFEYLGDATRMYDSLWTEVITSLW